MEHIINGQSPGLIFLDMFVLTDSAGKPRIPINAKYKYLPCGSYKDLAAATGFVNEYVIILKNTEVKAVYHETYFENYGGKLAPSPSNYIYNTQGQWRSIISAPSSSKNISI